jgi:hypothetical protein
VFLLELTSHACTVDAVPHILSSLTVFLNPQRADLHPVVAYIEHCSTHCDIDLLRPIDFLLSKVFSPEITYCLRALGFRYFARED